MKKIGIKAKLFLVCFLISSIAATSQVKQTSLTGVSPAVQFDFDTENSKANTSGEFQGKYSFVSGINGKALKLGAGEMNGALTIKNELLKLHPDKDFSVRFWIKTSMESSKSSTILAQKKFPSKSLESQKNAGWVFYISNGTWAWNMGSGNRRITHERDNGAQMPLNDGKWHQLTMTYDSKNAVIKLYYDGDNKALYNVRDAVGFNFMNDLPIIAGSMDADAALPAEILPAIKTGAEKLQQLVDAFNKTGVGLVQPKELEDLVVNPKELFDQKLKKIKISKGADSSAFAESISKLSFDPVTKARSALMRNPYTVHQVKDFMTVAPLLKIYSLVNDKIVIDQSAAMDYTKKEKLYQPDFELDNLAFWDRTLSSNEISTDYAGYAQPVTATLKKNISSFTAAVWNIHHGGIHNTPEKDGWDSRLRIAEMLKKENADVVMMQETYSNGDFIAAELGYYFASTVDWDYLNQGANVSVISRYPIKELYVPQDAPFMNVAVKVAISETQDMYVMSNWYGMQQFPAVYSFHEQRFEQADNIPILFAGDFNAVPHTDGGKSPASVKMLDNGFTDAFRSLHPDIKKYPGYTHEENIRIDQLYYKGKGLKNTSTKLITTWPAGFPSDHYLMIGKFDLKYTTAK